MFLVGRIALAFSATVLLLSSLAMGQGPQASKGEELYKSKCGACHGLDGKAQTKAGQMIQTPDLTKTPWKHGSSQAEVEKITREGFKKMPKFEGRLKPEEISAVSEYLRKLCKVAK